MRYLRPSSTNLVLRLFETVVRPAAVPADTALPRPHTCLPCRATAHMHMSTCHMHNRWCSGRLGTYRQGAASTAARRGNCPEPTVREITASKPVRVWGGRLRKLCWAQRRQKEPLHKSCVWRPLPYRLATTCGAITPGQRCIISPCTWVMMNGQGVSPTSAQPMPSLPSLIYQLVR